MTEIRMRSDFDVELVDSMGDDMSVVRAARVSVRGADEGGTETAQSQQGLINFLMKNRHGSPFEHNSFTFRISAPIFVWREFMRHRIASYNEESGRYRQLEPVFYRPPAHRPLVQEGRAGAYHFVRGSEDQEHEVYRQLREVASYAYSHYVDLLDNGVAREVARMVLPLNIYSTAYVTMNARALMNFLSLRTRGDNAAFPSFPQWEIERVALGMEYLWSLEMPLTYLAFNENGRVAP